MLSVRRHVRGGSAGADRGRRERLDLHEARRGTVGKRSAISQTTIAAPAEAT